MKKAKVFTSGNSQAVRLPREFRLKESEVFIKKVGDIIHLIPVKKNPWFNLEDALDKFDDSYFSGGRMQPEQQQREKI